MPTIHKLYEEAIKYEQSFLAHYIYCLLREGKVTLEDDSNVLDEVQADKDKLQDILQRNVLCVNKIKVYSLRKNPEYAFIFAENEEQASKYFQTIFNVKPKNCIEYSLDVEMARGNEVISIRELRKEHSTFPALAFVYEKPKCY